MPAALTRNQRIDLANEAIRIIGDHGRRFFRSERYSRYASIEADAFGRLRWRDDYTARPVNLLHPRCEAHRFSHGGTMRRLAHALMTYVRSGTPVPAGHFGPWPHWICDGDLWGYGDDMAAVRDAVTALGITDSQEMPETPDHG